MSTKAFRYLWKYRNGQRHEKKNWRVEFEYKQNLLLPYSRDYAWKTKNLLIPSYELKRWQTELTRLEIVTSNLTLDTPMTAGHVLLR